MPKSQSVIVIIKATFNPNGANSPEFKEYSQRSNANGEANGGVVTGKYKISGNDIEGDAPHLILTIEYPTKQAAIDTFTNEEYRSILPLRQVAFSNVEIFLANPIKTR